MDLDPVAFEFVIPSGVSINVINAINQLDLERARENNQTKYKHQ